nr:probable tubulin polyglutamylase TTLL2 isoform X2 [Monopterus albus]
MRVASGSALYDFSPTGFILPSDYTRFLAEYNQLHLTSGESVYWICKPVDLSRGRGIFIFKDIKDLVYDCSVIVQRYISDPLLISGYKFDLRIYVCVKSFHPLTVYIHQEGLVRFATEKYNLSSLHNLYAHLTNTSINKFGPFYKAEKERVGPGCKWTLSKFRHFLNSQEVSQLVFWQRINNIVTLTLLTIAPTVPPCPNCVELFGFDILIDVRLKPWLLEVNYSPALTLDCQTDITVKKGLISDLVDLMNYTSIDSLRERAYLKHRHKQPCFHATQSSRVPIPALSKFKGPKFKKKRSGIQSSQTQILPLLKPLLQSEKINQRQSRQYALVADCQRRLPPVDLDKTNAGRGRIINTSAARNQNSQSLHLILSPHSRTNVSVAKRQTCPALAPWLIDDRSLHVSEVTNHDEAETEAEMELSGGTDVSAQIPDIPQRELGFGSSAVSWKLPSIYSGSQRPVTIPLKGTRAVKEQHVPPLRVGGFIRTFPFNTATLKASQHKLDVKVIIQELHKLTAHLAPGQSDKTKQRREEHTDGAEDFESLLWGPKDPPLLSQCFRPT